MKIKNQAGQSTIEFILTFAFAVSFILVIFTTAINYATGYLIHYATFMASRVYLTQDNFTGTVGAPENALQDATQNARNAFNSYNLSAFNIPNDSFNIHPAGSTGPSEYLTVGGYTTFDQGIDPIGKVAGQQKLELVSESFLGKEPTRAECATRVCYAITGDVNCDRTMDITLYDDGC